MKDFLYFLKSKCGQIPAALEKKLFVLTTNVTGDAERKKRAGEEKAMRGCEYSRHDPAVMLPSPVLSAGSEGNTGYQPVPTVQLIEELELANRYWTAEQLDLMSPQTFVTSLETLGNVLDFSAAQLDVLMKKADMVQLSIFRSSGETRFPHF